MHISSSSTGWSCGKSTAAPAHLRQLTDYLNLKFKTKQVTTYLIPTKSVKLLVTTMAKTRAKNKVRCYGGGPFYTPAEVAECAGQAAEERRTCAFLGLRGHKRRRADQMPDPGGKFPLDDRSPPPLPPFRMLQNGHHDISIFLL